MQALIIYQTPGGERREWIWCANADEAHHIARQREDSAMASDRLAQQLVNVPLSGLYADLMADPPFRNLAAQPGPIYGPGRCPCCGRPHGNQSSLINHVLGVCL